MAPPPGYWACGLIEERECLRQAVAANHAGSGRSVNAQTQVADGNLAVIAHPHGGLVAKDVGPPSALFRFCSHTPSGSARTTTKSQLRS